MTNRHREKKIEREISIRIYSYIERTYPNADRHRRFQIEREKEIEIDRKRDSSNMRHQYIRRIIHSTIQI